MEKHKDEPFAQWVSFPDPYEPWLAAEQYAAMFPADKIDLPPRREGEFDDDRAPERNRALYKMLGETDDDMEDVYGVMGTYFGMVRFIEDCVGQILDAVEGLGLKKNTSEVFCSDHGDFMGEYRMQCKGGVFYDSLTRVLLIISRSG